VPASIHCDHMIVVCSPSFHKLVVLALVRVVGAVNISRLTYHDDDIDWLGLCIALGTRIRAKILCRFEY
jgi:hypothetical protein